MGKFNCQEPCPHLTPESVDNFVGEAIEIAYNASHFHTLARLLTPAHAHCLSRFKVKNVQSYYRSSCYLMKRLAQAFRHILDVRFKHHSQWFSYEWTLLMICLAHKFVSRRLNPHQKYKRFSFACKIDEFRAHIDLTSDYKTGKWKLNRELLRRQVKHFNKTLGLQLTLQEVTTKAKEQLNLAQNNKMLPRLFYIPWLNEKLLDPQNLLLFGKRKLKSIKLAMLGIDTPSEINAVHTRDQENTLTLRMANIRSLTQEKLQIDKATESLTNAVPDVYVYVESRYKPPEDKIGRYRMVFHSSFADGRGGTTILVKKSLGITLSETSIPDTVLLVLQKGQATVILAGTYFSHRINDKAQKFRLILEALNKLAERYSNPIVLLFGDLNMNEVSVQQILERSSHLLPTLNFALLIITPLLQTFLH